MEGPTYSRCVLPHLKFYPCPDSLQVSTLKEVFPGRTMLQTPLHLSTSPSGSPGVPPPEYSRLHLASELEGLLEHLFSAHFHAHHTEGSLSLGNRVQTAEGPMLSHQSHQR